MNIKLTPAQAGVLHAIEIAFVGALLTTAIGVSQYLSTHNQPNWAELGSFAGFTFVLALYSGLSGYTRANLAQVTQAAQDAMQQVQAAQASAPVAQPAQPASTPVPVQPPPALAQPAIAGAAIPQATAPVPALKLDFSQPPASK